jgi:nanoRNase/pAp phosphatase (c-di-AMP/oligoRNAs hydrolase)
MSLDSAQQLRKFLESSREILIALPENPTPDAISSAFALYFFLKKKGASPTIASSGDFSEKIEFLPIPKKIISKISGARDFVLSFDMSRNKITEIRHEEQEGKFNIYLTPEHGSIDPRDFSFILAKFKYDLVVILDSPDLEKLGKIYFDNPDLFFEVPVAVISAKSETENFGKINLIDVTASSVSEIVTDILDQINPDLIDEKIATSLLAGIIWSTDSFQKKNTTPKTFAAASSLMDKGADQQKIILWLYKTHPLHILKLWGRVMTKINWNPEAKFIWSTVSLSDFVESRGSVADVPKIIEKLRENFNDAQTFAIIYNENPVSSTAIIKTSSLENLQKLQLTLGGQVEKDFLKLTLEKRDLIVAGKELEGKIETTRD